MYEEYIDDTSTSYLYAEDELYRICCRVYTSKMTSRTPRIIRFTNRARIISDEEEQIAIILIYYEGFKEIEETLHHLQRKFLWKKMKKIYRRQYRKLSM